MYIEKIIIDLKKWLESQKLEKTLQLTEISNESYYSYIKAIDDVIDKLNVLIDDYIDNIRPPYGRFHPFKGFVK
jgi:hypothetical protein